ncbi:MAG: hypothetical protein C0594_18035 [Marinilabiliales bacterium]|nr:MAG: hypothetical protein C0594_18035 [Marinilabiliales bacterium]
MIAQELLKRHLNERIDHELVLKNKIKSIDYGDFVEYFDENGNVIYEKLKSWVNARVYSYDYNEEGKIKSRFSFDEGSTDTVRFEKYVYNDGILSEIKIFDTLFTGSTKYKYYKSGNIKGISNPNFYENYTYNNNGDIVNAVMKPKGEYLANSSKYKWKGIYNERNLLVKEIQTHDRKYVVTWLYQYDDDGNLLQCKNDRREHRKQVNIIKYEFNGKGLPVKRSYFDADNSLVKEQIIKYEFY